MKTKIASTIFLTFGLAAKLLAIPMHTSIDSGIQLPDHLAGYILAADHADPSLAYVAPRVGTVSTRGYQPEISFSHIMHDGQKFGILNVLFDFSISSSDFRDLKAAAREVNKRIAPMPFVRTKMALKAAGYEQSKKNGLCAEVTNPFDPQAKGIKCFNPIVSSTYSESGPKLGEKIFLSTFLSPAYAAALPNLLLGGAALGVEMNADYLQAFPAYTAEIHVKWEKLKESFSSFFAVHDGLCVDVEVKKHWEKELLCGQKMQNGKRYNLNGRECAIEINITDQHGKSVKNIYSIEDLSNGADNKEYTTWVNNHARELSTFQQMIQDLVKKFEDEMFTKLDIRTAEVSKEKTTLVTYRSDYVKKEERAEFTVTRKTLGRSITQTTVIPAVLGCINVDSTNGLVLPSSLGNCQSYWNNTIDPQQIIPASEGLISDARLETKTALEW